mgnify:CR=1 FL=1|jgi:hypothetical protein
MHHPSKHLVIPETKMKGIVTKTLEKQFPEINELREFVTFALLSLNGTSTNGKRLDVWLDEIINEYQIDQYAKETDDDLSE